MDWQTVFNVAVPIGAAIFGWFMRQLWEANKELRADLTNLRIHIPETYAPKSELEKFANALFAKLDRIEEKLDKKVDKG